MLNRTLLALVACAAVAAGCQKTDDATASTSTTGTTPAASKQAAKTTATTDGGIVGKWSGDLPGQQGAGVKMTFDFKADKNFTLTIGDAKRQQELTGTYTATDKDLTLNLASAKATSSDATEQKAIDSQKAQMDAELKKNPEQKFTFAMKDKDTIEMTNVPKSGSTEKPETITLKRSAS